MASIKCDYADCWTSLCEAEDSLTRLIRDGRDSDGQLQTALAVVRRSLTQITADGRRRVG